MMRTDFIADFASDIGFDKILGKSRRLPLVGGEKLDCGCVGFEGDEICLLVGFARCSCFCRLVRLLHRPVH
jgi:hypothetical protein